MIFGASAFGETELGGLRAVGGSGRTTSYGYDLHGNLVVKTLPNGEKVVQDFDALNRVISIEGKKPSGGGPLYGYAYRYDLAGNVVFIREDYDEPLPAGWRGITQGYDGAHRLVSEQYRYGAGGILGSAESDRDVAFEYDTAHNRTLKETHFLSPEREEREEYTYNDLNQLTELVVSIDGESSRTVEYGYDLNGNRISRLEGAAERGYAYDYEQRLVGLTDATLPAGYAYTYDYRTRRVAIASTPAVGSATTTALSFSGGTSVQEYADSTLTGEFIRGSDMGGGIGGILYSLRGGAASFTHFNNRGDVVAKTDTTSTLTYQAAYEAYGTRSEEAGSTLDPQKANTKDEDPTGLLNEGFRYRDLETGEFITRDPAGFVDGPNLYTYVRQNPWTRFDPEGLTEKPFDPSVDEPRNVHVGTATPLVIRGEHGQAMINPNAYNCHSYAWDNAKGDPKNPHNELNPPRWDDDPTSKMAKAQKLSPGAPSARGDIIVYGYDDNHNGKLERSEINHSAVVTAVDKDGNIVRVQEKEGGHEILDRHPGDKGVFQPHGSFREYYRPGVPTSPASPQPRPTPPPTPPPHESEQPSKSVTGRPPSLPAPIKRNDEPPSNRPPSTPTKRTLPE